jgi:phosphate transport system substrate-binding protein
VTALAVTGTLGPSACSGGSPGAPPAAASTIQAGLASFTNTPAQSYPTINYEYAIMRPSQASSTLARGLRAFLNWAISSGTAQLATVNFQPLPPSVVTLSQAQIAKIEG